MTVWHDQKKGYWIAKFRHQSRQYKREGFEKREHALKWEVEERERVSKKPTHLIFFKELSEKYLLSCRTWMEHNTVRQKATVYRAFLTFQGSDIPVISVTREKILDFRNHHALEHGNIAANRAIRDLKALFSWGINQIEELNFKNPVKGLEPEFLPENNESTYAPPISDINKVRLLANKDERDYLDALVLLAARKSEPLKWKWNEDIDFENRTVILKTKKRKTKNGNREAKDTMAMSDTLHNTLKSRWNNRNENEELVFNFSGFQLRNMLDILCKKAEVKRFTIMGIRKRVANVVNDSGKVPTNETQRLLRHQRESTTQIYLEKCSETMRHTVSLIDELTGTQAVQFESKKESEEMQVS